MQQACLEVEHVFGATTPRLEQQLHFHPDTGDAAVQPDEVVTTPANLGVPAHKPVIPVHLGNHDLQLPCLYVGAVAPDVVNALGQVLAVDPWTERSRRIGCEQLPAGQHALGLQLLIAKDHDIRITVLADGRAEKQLDRVATADTPRTGRVGEELHGVRKRKWLPVMLGNVDVGHAHMVSDGWATKVACHVGDNDRDSNRLYSQSRRISVCYLDA
jgi:hypothetical protein